MAEMEYGNIISIEALAPDIYSMWIRCRAAYTSRPGQFISLYMDDGVHLLPRPISICDYDAEKGALRIVFRILGEGTAKLSKMLPGDSVRLMGPLGNGYPLDEVKGKESVLLVAGGIGIPPMVALAKEIKKNNQDIRIISVMGYRDSHIFLQNELEEVSEFKITTDDGSMGFHGTVTDFLKNNDVRPEIILSCGPKPMLRSLYEFSENIKSTLYVSMEERMACGIGACLACVCKTKDMDDHSKVKNARVCKDGPVFKASEVEL
ncbi:MAG: dihydroorotate dehydrogenase electron transfer subunit [Lachnospiraceae bacterium]|nr:dihydroorotate dehydrogenase electron transfer subunit [Lachnospiraceae bacterium]